MYWSSCVEHSTRSLFTPKFQQHYTDVIMGAIASQITSLTIVYSTVYSDADQRKHQSSASLVFFPGIHREPVNPPHKWPVMRKNVSIWWRHHEIFEYGMKNTSLPLNILSSVHLAHRGRQVKTDLIFRKKCDVCHRVKSFLASYNTFV